LRSQRGQQQTRTRRFLADANQGESRFEILVEFGGYGDEGGMCKALEIAGSSEGKIRRTRRKESAAYLKSLLVGKVNLGTSDSWILTVEYGNGKNTLGLYNFLQQNGLDTSIIQFPAVKKSKSSQKIEITMR